MPAPLFAGLFPRYGSTATSASALPPCVKSSPSLRLESSNSSRKRTRPKFNPIPSDIHRPKEKDRDQSQPFGLDQVSRHHSQINRSLTVAARIWTRFLLLSQAVAAAIFSTHSLSLG